MSERNFQFRQRLNEVHRSDRRDPETLPAQGEVAVGGAGASASPRMPPSTSSVSRRTCRTTS